MIKRIFIVTIFICISARAFPDPGAAVPAGDRQDQGAPDTQQTASSEPENDPNELICRRERETGSKFTRKVCRTRAEIEARTAQDQKIIQDSRKIRTGPHCAINKDC